MERVKRAKLVELLRKDYVQTVIMVIITIVIVIVFWYGLRFAFRTEHPLLAVASGSMEPVLYEGDLILVQGVQNALEIHVAPKDANSPGDIIVFRKPTYPSDLIVHRAVGNGTDTSYYIITQGDANPSPDGWRVRETDIIGKLVEINPPFWTYNYIFWGIVLASGAVILSVGVILKFL